MPNYKTFESAIKDLIPDLDKMGRKLKERVTKTIVNSEVLGERLSNRTLKNKAPETRKLYDGGDLSRQVMFKKNEMSVDVGYTSKSHSPRKPNKAKIKLSRLAEIHNEGIINQKERPFLTKNKQWLKQYKETAEKEYQLQLKNKGIL